MELSITHFSGAQTTTTFDKETKATVAERELGSDIGKMMHIVITVSGTTTKIYKKRRVGRNKHRRSLRRSSVHRGDRGRCRVLHYRP